jgi:hypothetical protein
MSIIWTFVKKPDAGSEHSEDDDSENKGEIHILQHPRWSLYQQQSNYRNLTQVGLLLLSMVALHYIYLGSFAPHKVKYSNAQNQSPSLHFSTPTGTHNAPICLFIEENKTWHIYFQC